MSSSATRSRAATIGCSRSTPGARSLGDAATQDVAQRAGRCADEPDGADGRVADRHAHGDRRPLAVPDDRGPPQVELAARAHGADRVARVVDAGEQVALLPGAAPTRRSRAGRSAGWRRRARRGASARRARRPAGALGGRRREPAGVAARGPSRRRGRAAASSATSSGPRQRGPSRRRAGVSVAASDSVAGAEAELARSRGIGPMVRSRPASAEQRPPGPQRQADPDRDRGRARARRTIHAQSAARMRCARATVRHGSAPKPRASIASAIRARAADRADQQRQQLSDEEPDGARSASARPRRRARAAPCRSSATPAP